MFSPSSSKSEDLVEYEEAEIYGKFNKDCRKYAKQCTRSILDLVSTLGDVMY